MSVTAIMNGRAFALCAGLLALAGCGQPAPSSGGPVNESSAPALSGAPVASSAPASDAVNPAPAPGAPPPNAGDVQQSKKSMGPGGPVNSPRRLKERGDSARR